MLVDIMKVKKENASRYNESEKGKCKYEIQNATQAHSLLYLAFLLTDDRQNEWPKHAAGSNNRRYRRTGVVTVCTGQLVSD